MRTDNFCFYLQNKLIQTSQTGDQRYSDASPFSIPCLQLCCCEVGDCDIHARRKISFMNETKRYDIWPGPKGSVQKIFQNLPLNFVKGLNVI
jgi:hypothetical protein